MTLRLRPLTFGAGALLIAFWGAGFLSIGGPGHHPSRSERQTDQIRQFRWQGRYGEALNTARDLSRALERDARASAWQRADASRLVGTLAIASNLPDSARRALAEADRADATIHDLMIQGQYRRAAAQVRKQLAVRCKVLGEEAPDVAVSLSAMGDLDMVQGDVRGAADSHGRALDLRRRILGEGHPEVAQSLESLGLAQKNLNNLDEARACYKKSYEMRRELFGEEHPCIAASMNRQADLLRRDGRIDDAVVLLRRALHVLETTEGLDTPEAAEVLSNLGLVLYVKEDYEAAEQALRRVVKPGHWVSGVSMETVALSSSLYGAVLWKQRRYGEAEPVQRKSAKVYEFLRYQCKPGGRPYHGLGIHAQVALTQLERGEFEAAWASLERSLSRSLLDGLEPPADTTAQRSLHNMPDDDRFCGLEQVQSHISDQTALVGWVTSFRSAAPVWDYPVWGYVIRRHGPVHWVRIDPPSASASEAGTTAMFDMSLDLSNEAAWPVRMPADPEVTRKAEQVYRDLVLPLQPFLSGATHLVIVRAFLHGSFNAETLVDPDGSFLGARCAVSYTPSATLYVWMREHACPRQDPRTWRVLAVGDPAPAHVGLAARNRTVLSGAFRAGPMGVNENASPLPGSREEVRCVAAIFAATRVMLGSEASKQNLASLARKGGLRDFDLIHLAVHTRPGDRKGNTARLLFGSAGDATQPPGGGAVEDPDRIGCEEILSTWKLDADLVTVSACRSAGSSTGTDPLVQLSEAFLRAGARSLLVSPWDVDDAATSLLMERFYQNLAGAYEDERLGRSGQPMSKVRALHEARNWLREYRDSRGRQPYANPIYWAAFILVGDAGE